MRNYSQEEIDYLLSCRKEIVSPPRKSFKLERGSFRNDFKMESVDGKHFFPRIYKV